MTCVQTVRDVHPASFIFRLSPVKKADQALDRHLRINIRYRSTAFEVEQLLSLHVRAAFEAEQIRPSQRLLRLIIVVLSSLPAIATLPLDTDKPHALGDFQVELWKSRLSSMWTSASEWRPIEQGLRRLFNVGCCLWPFVVSLKKSSDTITACRSRRPALVHPLHTL